MIKNPDLDRTTLIIIYIFLCQEELIFQGYFLAKLMTEHIEVKIML